MELHPEKLEDKLRGLKVEQQTKEGILRSLQGW